MRNTSKIIVLLLLAVLVVGGLAALQLAPRPDVEALSSTETPQPAPSVPARWVAAAPGRVEPKSGEIRVGSAAIGRIVEVPVRVGDRVAAGDLLIRLDDQEAQARVAAAKAEVAVRTLERDEQSAPGTLERPASPARAEAALATARAELTVAEAVLEKMRVRAPVAGTVLLVSSQPGELAAPSIEQALIVLGDLSALRVRAEVDERDAGRMQIGQRVTVKSDAFRDAEFAGKVATIAPGLGPPRINARETRRSTDANVLEVMIDLDGAPPFTSGMRVDAYFAADQPAERER